jgi:signal transduction histidine kinase
MAKNQSAGERSSGTSSEIPCVPDSSFRREPAKWGTRLVNAGSLLTLLFQIVYMAFDLRFLSIARPWILIFHSLNIALYGVATATSSLISAPWMRRQWKAVAFTFSSIMILNTTAITILTGQIEPLFLMIVLFLAGTGTFLSWGGRTQALLSLAAMVAFAVAIENLPGEIDPYQWLTISIAAAIGMFSAALLKGLRRAGRQAETELLRIREMLVRQERLRLVGKLISGIAHDLDNTLNVVQLRLFALKLDEDVLNNHSELLEVIDSKLEIAALIVIRIRELSVILSGGQPQI